MKKIITLIAIAIFCSATTAKAQTPNVDVVFLSSSATTITNQTGGITSVVYKFTFVVTNNGNTSYLGQTIKLGTVATGTNGIAFVIQKSNSVIVDDTTFYTTTSLTSTDATVEGNGYRLDEGSSKHFTVMMYVTNPLTQDILIRAQMKQIRLFAEPALINGTNIDLEPSEYFRTGFIYLNGSTTGISNKLGNGIDVQISSCPTGVRIFSEKNASAEIYTITSQKVGTFSVLAGQEFFPSLPNGMYIIRLSTGGNYVITQRVVMTK
ncbi:MAG: T9SS type A sorting domain-containing protein [Candidatus Pacebacteria bacterium]|nr:T9SS type A sorting domain-containing protein [Candidatus Paceibacterota bacterium]